MPRADHSLVLVARAESDPADALGWVAAEPVEAIPGLARKLPHYTRYSYLGFKGSGTRERRQGDVAAARRRRWFAISPMVNCRSWFFPSARRSPSCRRSSTSDRLAAHRRLSRATLPGGPRPRRARDSRPPRVWVERQLTEAGVAPAGDAGYRQSWTWQGGEPERSMDLTNLIAAIPGTDPKLPPVLVMAHLDHLGTGWPDVRTGNEGQRPPRRR